MDGLEHPAIETVELHEVFHALSDPLRLAIVRKLGLEGRLNCSALTCNRPRSTMSHHFRVLRAAGLVHTHVVGNEHMNSLRRDDLEGRFPGLVALILGGMVSLAA